MKKWEVTVEQVRQAKVQVYAKTRHEAEDIAWDMDPEDFETVSIRNDDLFYAEEIEEVEPE